MHSYILSLHVSCWIKINFFIRSLYSVGSGCPRVTECVARPAVQRLRALSIVWSDRCSRIDGGPRNNGTGMERTDEETERLHRWQVFTALANTFHRRICNFCRNDMIQCSCFVSYCCPSINIRKCTPDHTHSFIHYGYLYSASSRLLLGSAPYLYTAKKE